jgi:hypothetical protein
VHGVTQAPPCPSCWQRELGNSVQSPSEEHVWSGNVPPILAQDRTFPGTDVHR